MGGMILFKATIITAAVLLLSVPSAFTIKESDMNKYSTIFCRHYLAGGGKEGVLMQFSAYYICRYPGTSGELKTNIEVRLKTGKTVAEFSYKKDPRKFPSPGVVFVK